MINPLRELIKNNDIYSGKWMPIFLETVPGSEERICIAVAIQGEDGNSKVVRTLHPRTVRQLFGLKSGGIDKAINWIVEDLSLRLSRHELDLAFYELPVTGFKLGAIEFSASQSFSGLLEKAVGLSTSVGGLYVDDEERQMYFSSQLKYRLKKFDKSYSNYIDKHFRVHDRKVRFGIVTESLIGHYHGINTNTASYNSALAKMVTLENLKLEGILDQCHMDREFFIARTENGNNSVSQNRLIGMLQHDLDKREIPSSVYNGPGELAERLHSTLRKELPRD